MELASIKNIRATSELNVNYDPDVVLLTTKSFDTENAIRALQPLISDDSNTVVISLQNGIGNEELIAQYVGEDHTMGGMVITGFELSEPSKVEVTVSADITKIGELTNEITPRLRKIVALFNEAGIPSCRR